LTFGGKTFAGKAIAVEVYDAPIIVKTQAEIKLINSMIFNIIQELQKGIPREKKQQLVETLK